MDCIIGFIMVSFVHGYKEWFSAYSLLVAETYMVFRASCIS